MINLTNRVKGILEKDGLARRSDRHLYLMICQEICPETELKRVNLYDYLTDSGIYGGMPDFATISRCRRKVQEKYPELRSGGIVKGYREEKEKEYREYARMTI